MQARYPDGKLKGKRANILVFANIGFNLVRTLAETQVVGLVMLGIEKPAHTLQPHCCGVSDVVHLTALAYMNGHPSPLPTHV
ncbi:MAG: phosphate acyltransferase [Planctomycetota bacterium]|nr:phosphate acyltransferase [Planctomycetota bacterium]